MQISLKKFGTILTSRQLGKEAWASFQPSLSTLPANSELILDFSGVDVFSPSWADEFLTPLQQKFGAKLKLQNVINASALATIAMLEKIHQIKFSVI